MIDEHKLILQTILDRTKSKELDWEKVERNNGYTSYKCIIGGIYVVVEHKNMLSIRLQKYKSINASIYLKSVGILDFWYHADVFKKTSVVVGDEIVESLFNEVRAAIKAKEHEDALNIASIIFKELEVKS